MLEISDNFLFFEIYRKMDGTFLFYLSSLFYLLSSFILLLNVLGLLIGRGRLFRTGSMFDLSCWIEFH